MKQLLIFLLSMFVLLVRLKNSLGGFKKSLLQLVGELGLVVSVTQLTTIMDWAGCC
jgi:hypothetical protein